MAGKKRDNPADAPRILNRKARHDYHIQSSLEVGIVLVGSEVKSIRNGQASLAEGFAMVDDKSMTLSLFEVDIAKYAQAGPFNHEPRRVRRLLAHKREIKKLLDQSGAKGSTLVPLAMYFVRGKVKVELGLGVGKKAFDKREDLKKKDSERAMRRAMTRRTL